MKLSFPFIALLCLVNFNHGVSVSRKSTSSQEENSGDSRVANPLLDTYTDCSITEKEEEQLHVNGMKQQIAVLLSADMACDFIVQFCAKQEKKGTHWKATIKACDIEENIVFFVDSDDATHMPKELRLMDRGYSNALAAAEDTLADSIDDSVDDNADVDRELDASEYSTGDDTNDDAYFGGIVLPDGVAIACPSIADYVCCNGVDYDNKCMAKADGVKVLTQCVKGQCGADDTAVDAADDVAEITDDLDDGLEDVEVDEPEETSETEGDNDSDDDDDDDDELELLVEALQDYPDLVEKIKGIRTGKSEENKGMKPETDWVACTMDYKPLCCGSIDYDNDCLANADGVLDVDTECVSGTCTDADDNTDNDDVDDVSDTDDSYDDDADDVADGDDDGVVPLSALRAKVVKDNPDQNRRVQEMLKELKDAKAKELKYSAKSKTVMCTREYDPLCCDGVDYDNSCLARADGRDEKKCDKKECKNNKKDDDKKKKKKRKYAADTELQMLEAKLADDQHELAALQRLKAENDGEDSTDDDDDESADSRDYDNSEYSTGDAESDMLWGDNGVVAPQSAKKSLDNCLCAMELNEQCCHSGKKEDWTDYATLCDAKCDKKVKDNCLPKRCSENPEASAAMVGHHSYLTGGLVQSTTHSSQWNIMIVIIQLCILAVCCMSLGLSISFCFKNPNQLMGAGKKRFANDMV